MRHFRFAALAFLFATLLPCASFASDVLLPSSSGDTSSYPNLGLGVTSSPSPAAAPAPIPAPATTNPAPMQTGGSTPIPADASIMSPIDQDSAAKLPLGTVPTQVIQQPDMSAALAQMGANLPYNITFSIDGRSIFGARDVETITEKLGLTREQIPSSCILTVRGMIHTDKGAYMIDGPASPQMPVRYDGIIQGYVLNAAALCTAGRLPPGSGYLVETNGRFTVPLQALDCQPPSRQATQLAINYNGSDAAQCVYR